MVYEPTAFSNASLSKNEAKKKHNKTVSVNQMSESRLKKNVEAITRTYANIVAGTAGPFGKNTIIQTADRTYSTKDGWTVAQAVEVDEEPSVKSLAKMILDVSASVYRTVGDGTTTSILGADRLLSYINQWIENHSYPPTSKFIETTLETGVGLVCEQLEKMTKPITMVNMYDTIYCVALIATNWDEPFAKMIADIYQETLNPIIEVKNSGSDKSYVEYVEGYEVQAQLQLQNYYLLSSDENGKVALKKPIIIVFDYNIPGRLFNQLCMIAQMASQSGSPLVVLAPGYETEFISQVSSFNVQQLQNKKPILPLFPVKYFTPSYVERDMIDDLCALVGAQIITKENAELEALMGDLYNYMFSSPNKPKPGATATEITDYDARYQKYCEERDKLIADSYVEFQKVAGICETCTISNKQFQVSGLTHQVTDLVQNRIKKLEAEMNRKMKEADSLNFVTAEMYPTRIRLGKLRCRMGTIYVGGYGESNLSAKRAALDDAIRACQSCYLYGYTIGVGYAIPRACVLVKEAYPNMDSAVIEVINSIGAAFTDVICRVAANKVDGNLDIYPVKIGNCEMPFRDAVREITEKGLPAYNIVTDSLDECLIEPSRISIESLKASMRVVMISATSNQYLYRKY